MTPHEIIEACAKCIPTTWLDPALSGSERLVNKSPSSEIELLLRGMAKRIRALKATIPDGVVVPFPIAHHAVYSTSIQLVYESAEKRNLVLDLFDAARRDDAK